MSQTSPPSNSAGERIAAAGIAAVVVVTVLVGALAPRRAELASRTAADDPDCLEWTDGCQVCQRWPEGVSCSLPGIACQPGEVRCLRRGDG